MSATGQGPAGLRAIPKAEIHLHLEGSVEPATLARILETRGEGAGAAARAALHRLYEHPDFPGFLRNFRDLCSHLRRPEDFARITGALAERLHGEGVRYAEVFCSPSIFAAAGPGAAEIMEAVSGAARERETAGGPRLRFLFDGVRQFGVASLEGLVEAAGDCRRFGVIGIGMGGDERALPAAAFAGAFREARRRGLRTTVHAGEFDGPRSVWEAMEVLEVERIGHGVRAAEDPALVRELARRGLPLECCPTSNLRTGIVASWETHPLRRLHEAGVAVTVNSDDPALFGTTLVGEWEALTERLGLEPAAVLEIGRRTVRSAFLPDADKEALVTEMDRGAAAAGFGR